MSAVTETNRAGIEVSQQEAWDIAAAVCDPELPVLTIADLGILRGVDVRPAQPGSEVAVRVTITPTYSGCPAMDTIRSDVRAAFEKAGLPGVEVVTVLSAAWTTDWMTTTAREALRQYGIAPPAGPAPGLADGSQLIDIACLLGASNQPAVPCPQCDSTRTRLLSQFGSTACKALYRCNSCLEPFDYFKPH